MFRELSDDFNIAWTLVRLAYCNGTMGNPELMVEYSRQGLEMSRKAGDDYSASFCLGYIGWITWLTGDVDEGEGHLQEALAISLKLNDRIMIGHIKAALGRTALLQGDVEHANDLGEETLTIARDILDHEGIGGALVLLGIVANLEEDYEEGRRLCQESRAYLAPNPFYTDYVYMGLFMSACGLEDTQAMQDYHCLLLPARGGGKRTLMYPIITSVIMLAYQGKAERAVELLGLYFALPPNVTGWMEKWPLLTRLRADLEAALGADAYNAVWERGAALDLETVAAELLAEFGESQQSGACHTV